MEADLIAQKVKVESFMDMLDGHPQGNPETIKLRELLELQRSGVDRMIKELGGSHER